MSIVFPNRTFEQTFPCGTSMLPCSGQCLCSEQWPNSGHMQPLRGCCPVEYDNFASDSPAPFFLEKYRELVDVINNCRIIPDDNVSYYTNVNTPVNQYVTVNYPYKINNGVYPRRIKEMYYRVQY